MGSDSIITRNNASFGRDLGEKKKKKVNRSAKLKQCKLDARREQWLSQGVNVKGKGGKDELAKVGLLPVPYNACEEERRKGRWGGGLVVAYKEEEEEENDDRVYWDSSLASISPTGSSILCGTDFSGLSSVRSSSSCGGCCSGSVTEEEGGGVEDNCLDDWEAVADALAVGEDHHNQGIESEVEVSRSSHEHVWDVSGLDFGPNVEKQESASMEPPRWATGSNRAWTPGDVFRPQNLPVLSKQLSFTTGVRHNPIRGGSPWVRLNAVNVPSSCPICCEELDCTDTSFLPCLCGFRLCLFCHKRILEEDGRCPGCRKPYEEGPFKAEASVHEGSHSLRLACSRSFNARS